MFVCRHGIPETSRMVALRTATRLLLCSLLGATAHAQEPAEQAPATSARDYVTISAPSIAFIHVRLIDGTGAPARTDQTVLVADGRITAVGNAASVTVPAGAQTIDLTGKSLLPGLVMVHEHLFYPVGRGNYGEMAYSFPRMYLGGGATTIRTGGSMHPYADLNVRKYVDAGQLPGPKIDVTGPYLTGPGIGLVQFHELTDDADARRTVAQWADLGATSFKAYMHITRDELKAAADEAHKRGLRITGHLCSVTFREAADAGIDNLEHGLVTATDFVAGKKPDECIAPTGSLASLDLKSDTLQSLIRHLVAKKVAITSTLVVFENLTPQRPPLPDRSLEAMTPDTRLQYLTARARIAGSTVSPWLALFKKEMAFEKMFADAGGLLLAGSDPTGIGGVIPGYSNQRELELLVEAGFTPLEAIRIGTLNGATYLGRAAHVGSIAVGKDADLLVVAGDPSTTISDIERIETVFKDGVGYDSGKLLSSGKGSVGAQ
jgi:imidazolonepropionase-like amidohydrolase